MKYNTENFLFIDAAKYREETSGRIILAATIWLYLTNGRLGQFWQSFYYLVQLSFIITTASIRLNILSKRLLMYWEVSSTILKLKCLFFPNWHPLCSGYLRWYSIEITSICFAINILIQSSDTHQMPLIITYILAYQSCIYEP